MVKYAFMGWEIGIFGRIEALLSVVYYSSHELGGGWTRQCIVFPHYISFSVGGVESKDQTAVAYSWPF